MNNARVSRCTALARGVRRNGLPLGLAVLVFFVCKEMLTQASTTTAHRAPNTPRSGPDLVPFLEWSPAYPTISDTLIITYGATNAGDAPASPNSVVYARMYFGEAQTPTLATAHSHADGTALTIQPRQRRPIVVLTGNFAITNTQGTSIWVWADPTNDAAESNESNNLVRFFVPPLQPPELDIYENDDGCLQARPIQMSVAQTHTLAPASDEDWVTFAVDSNRKYMVTVLKVGVDAEPSMEIHLGCNAPPSVISGVSYITSTSHIWESLVAGQAYVRVRQRLGTSGPSATYTLAVQPLEVCYSEPNNTCETASPIVVGAAGGGNGKQGNFCASGDEDWYRFEARAGLAYNIQVSGLTNNVQPKISAIESEGCGGAPVFGEDDSFTYSADRDGPAQVLIRNTNPVGFGPISDYAITVTVAGCAPDAQEPNNSANAARRIAVDQSPITLNGCPAQDEDWFAFDARANTTYYIETLPTTADEMRSDTQIEVFDADKVTRLALDDDTGPGLGARAAIRLPNTQLVYVRVRQHNARVAGATTAYGLSVRTTPCQADANEAGNGNNSPTTATHIVSGTASANALCPAADKDWFEFTVPPGTYALATSDLGAAADTMLTLYQADASTQIQFNDDYEPKGLGSRVVFSTTTATMYRVLVTPRVAANVGSGVQYSLTLQADSPLVLTRVNPDSVSLNPPPVASAINTLIVTNRERLGVFYEAAQVDTLMVTLDTFKKDTNVMGELIDLNLNNTVRAAYADWATHANSVDYANAVALSIRNLILATLNERPSIQHLVIVGDDRIVPFHRIPDASLAFPESAYTYTLAASPIGQAQRQNYFLTDDCFSAATLSQRLKQAWCVPLLATGRLVETPLDVTRFITRFLTNNAKMTPAAPHMALVGGYDFVKDSAEYTCEKLQARFGNSQVDCSLIGNDTLLANQRALQLAATPPYVLHSFHGHGTHFALGINRSNEAIFSDDIANAFSAPEGGLMWTPACHIGLSLPPDNASNPLDFPQAYMQRGVNLIANTGYGWGTSGGIAYSEYMAQYLVNALTSGSAQADVQIGQALRRAKWKYFSQQRGEDVLHPKVAMQMVLYGLPMYRLHGAGLSRLQPSQAWADEDDFPSISGTSIGIVDFEPRYAASVEFFSLPSTVLPSALLSRTQDVSGTRYALDGRVTTELGESIQPRFYRNLLRPDASLTVRGVWIISATYQVLGNVTTTLAAVTNEYGTTQLAPDAGAWDNAELATVRALPAQDVLVAYMGQGNAEAQQIRLTQSMSTVVFYSKYPDSDPPRLLSVGLARETNNYSLKIKAEDPVGVDRAGVLFTDGRGEWRSQDLTFDKDSQSWLGNVSTSSELAFAVQVADADGNVARFSNKGRYYRAQTDLVPPTSDDTRVYLPMVMR